MAQTVGLKMEVANMNGFIESFCKPAVTKTEVSTRVGVEANEKVRTTVF